MREAQGRDPQQKNERLRAVLADAYFDQVPRSAEAAARLLEGRIYAQRIASGQALLNDMRVFGEMNTGAEVPFQAGPVEELLKTAQQEGKTTLDKAVALYQQVASKLGAQRPSWLPLIGQAAVEHLLAGIDLENGAAHLQAAADAVQKAFDKREQSPYLRPFAGFYSMLTGGGNAPAAAPAEGAKEGAKEAGKAGETPAEKPEKKEDGGFFGD